MVYRKANVGYVMLLIFLMLQHKTHCQVLSDRQSTKLTKYLFNNLKQARSSGIMFGQQDSQYSTVLEQGRFDNSDIKKLTGKHPAINGWDLGKIESGSKSNIDHVPFDSLAKFARRVYEEGGINTFSWHCSNPIDLSVSVKSNKIENTISKLLGNPEEMKKYDACLDSAAAFLKKITTSDGEAIPILFRPFHENTGSWFWWGKKRCTPEEYKQIWIYTVKYLREKWNLRNLIFVYSTSYFTSESEYLERYPGDEYADILGFDFYDKDQFHKSKTDAFNRKLRLAVNMLKEIADKHNKLFALTETGYKLMPVETWWTESLYSAIAKSGMSYVLIWRNAGPNGYWGTFPGQASGNNFQKFADYKDILFQPEVKRLKVYKAVSSKTN